MSIEGLKKLIEPLTNALQHRHAVDMKSVPEPEGPTTKLSDFAKSRREQGLVRKVKAYSWDMGMCPECRRTTVQTISTHETTGESYYECRSCGSKGFGQWGEDPHPTLEQIQEYESRLQHS